MGDVRYLDQSGVYALADLIEDLHGQDTEVYMAELHEEPLDILHSLSVIPTTLPEERVFESAQEAIREATDGVTELSKAS